MTKTPESYVVQAVKDLLDAERIWYMRCNAGVQVIRGENGRKRVIRGHEAGTADLLAILSEDYCPGCGARPARPLGPGSYKSACCGRTTDTAFVPVWLECKRPKGGVQSEAQREFQRRVEQEGHVYLLVSDVRQVMEFLRGKR